jgi:hypothetical protein
MRSDLKSADNLARFVGSTAALILLTCGREAWEDARIRSVSSLFVGPAIVCTTKADSAYSELSKCISQMNTDTLLTTLGRALARIAG